MQPIHGMNPRQQHGVTLIELITAMAIVAVLLGIAVPGFAEMRQNAARRATMDDFWHAIFLARSEAIKRNSVVALCRTTDGTHCDNAAAEWSDGWLVFDNLDHDDPAERDPTEPILQVYGAHRPGHITSNRKTFSFRPNTQGSVNGTIVFCDARSAPAARAIIISHTGRPRQSQRDASNQPLTCPL